MSKKIYLHMVKVGMIKLLKVTEPGLSKDKRMSQQPRIKYNLKRYSK